MNKDALLATFIGFVIGLLITGLILVGPNVIKYLPKISIQIPAFPKKEQTSPTPEPAEKLFTLTIDSPINESIETSDSVLVSGTTTPETLVVISGNTNDEVVKANNNGSYAGTIALVEGKNEIIVTGYNNDQSLTQYVTVFYTEESL